MPMNVSYAGRSAPPPTDVTSKEDWENFESLLKRLLKSPVVSEINKQLYEWLPEKNRDKFKTTQVEVEIQVVTHREYAADYAAKHANPDLKTKAEKEKERKKLEKQAMDNIADAVDPNTGETSKVHGETSAGRNKITIRIYCDTMDVVHDPSQLIIHELVHAKLHAAKRFGVDPPFGHHDGKGHQPPFRYQIPRHALHRGEIEKTYPVPPDPPENFYQDVDKFYDVLAEWVHKNKK